MATKQATPQRKASTPKAPAAAPARRRIVDDEDPAPPKGAVTETADADTSADADTTAAPVVGDGIIDTPAEALAAAKDRVIVQVPRPYRLRIDSHKVISYPAGAYAMDKEHAEHWFSRGSGVTIIDPK